MPQDSLTGDRMDDRKLGLEYQLRRHPWATPGAEASGITEPNQAAHGADTTPLSHTDPVMAFISYLERRIAPDSEYGVYTITTVGQYFIRPNILIHSVSNLCDGNIILVLAEGERNPGKRSLRVGLAANSSPTPSLRWHFSRAFVVRQVFTTSGPVATAQMTIGGTWAAGQIYTATITSPNPLDPTGAPLTATLAYTTTVGDANNAGAAVSFVAAWNANTTLASIATASNPSGAIILLTAVNPGSLVEQSTISLSSTGTGTFVLNNTFVGALNPEVAVSFE